jgi:hypothetical protein
LLRVLTFEGECVILVKTGIMIAELYRNLGKYAECNNILDTIEDKEHYWLKEISSIIRSLL